MYPIFVAIAVLIAVVWGLVVSPTFRVVAVILVGLGVLAVMWAGDEAQKSTEAAAQAKAREAVAEKQRTEQVEALWSKVPASRVELRELALTGEDAFFGNRYTLSASIKNLSDVELGGFEIQITALDCVARAQCDTVGHATETFWSGNMIPPQEVRGITGKVDLDDLPKPRGKLTWNLRVFAGDLLDEWLPRHD